MINNIVLKRNQEQQRFQFEKGKQILKFSKMNLMHNKTYSNSASLNQQQQQQYSSRLLKQLQVYPNEEQISLQQSIPILYELNIFQQLTSIPDAKKRLMQNQPNLRLQLEARFIYNMWKMIGQETILIRTLKDIVVLFMTQEPNKLAISLEALFQNDNQAVVQMLAIWEGMLQTRQFGRRSSQSINNQSALLQTSSNVQKNDYQSMQQKAPKTRKQSYSSYSRQNQSKQNFQSMHRQAQSNTSRYKTSDHQNLQSQRNIIYNNNHMFQIPIMSVQRQKQLVSRLYRVNKYQKYQQMKRIQDEQKIQKQLQQCTFKPNTHKAIKSNNKSDNKSTQPKVRADSCMQKKKIPGFQKAIQRMKTGQQKTKQLKQKLELRNIGLKSSAVPSEQKREIVPPRFLTRVLKKEQKVLFTIQFDIGRHKLTTKIHENDRAQKLARNIQSIYSLKQQNYEEIKQIIQDQMERYFILKQRDEEDHQFNQSDHNHTEDIGLFGGNQISKVSQYLYS